jgi:diguanylate cyclase (GGDEF)-like protein/PAS domain S-box-containing protein
VHHSAGDRDDLSQLTVGYPSFRIEAANRAMCLMSGFDRDELAGQDVAMLFPVNQLADRAAVERLVAGATEGYAIVRPLERRDGSLIPVRWTISALRNTTGAAVRLSMFAQDLTELHEVEEWQRRSRGLIDVAVSSLPLTFSTLDTNLRFTFVAGGPTLPAAAVQKYLGRHISSVTVDPRVIQSLEEALGGVQSTVRLTIRGRTYVAVNSPLRGNAGAILGVVSVASNVTDASPAATERRAADAMALFVARHDSLTALPGRFGLVEHLNDLAASDLSGGSLLILDLDDFSLVSDSFGANVGDSVLREVSSRVTEAFPGMLVARYGDDKFAVVVPSAFDPDQAEAAAERVKAALEPDLEIGPHHSLRVTATVGIAVDHSRGPSSALMRDADSALTVAKEAGSGQFRLFDTDLRRQLQDRLRMQDGLRIAMLAGQLSVAYQPIVTLAERRIVGAEALLRWFHPQLGPIPQGEFIPMAERSGLIVPMGQWVMNAAGDDMLALEREFGLYVSVNVSVRQLSDVRFAGWVEEMLDRTGLPPHALVLEVTESALMDNISQTRTAFERLREPGVRVCIDDFGTGYSSLARLQQLPVDMVKLDRAFVTGVDVRPQARTMAEAILHLSAAIGAEIVAEGVETEAEASTLADLGYRTAQGYLFARPMALSELNAGVASSA